MSTNEAGNSLFVKSNTKYGEKTVEIVPVLLAQPNGARFFGKQGLACLKRRSRKLQLIQFLFAPEKPCEVREVWQNQTCARSRLSLLPFFGEAKKGSAQRWHEAQRGIMYE